MDDINKGKLVKQITAHEGFKQFPYRCTAGRLTIGIGRNIQDNGITLEEAQYLLGNDVKYAIFDCKKMFQDFDQLEAVRQCVLVNMMFNMGADVFGGFKNFKTAILKKDYQAAANEMQDSVWFRQVGNRAVELQNQLSSGKWQS